MIFLPYFPVSCALVSVYLLSDKNDISIFVEWENCKYQKVQGKYGHKLMLRVNLHKSNISIDYFKASASTYALLSSESFAGISSIMNGRMVDAGTTLTDLWKKEYVLI